VNGHRHTADSITDDALDELYAERDELRQRFHNQAHAATELIEQLGTTEAELVAARSSLDRVRQMTDAWEQRLPDTIRTATAVEALRAALPTTA
jgi:predicted nuclease with TOPRIM domain